MSVHASTADPLSTDPVARFAAVFAKAVAADPESGNACVLSTVGRDGGPSARVVLLKSFDARGFVFFTNLLSRKAQEMHRDPRATLTFFWSRLGEQVRVEGTVTPVDEAEAQAYFSTRPRLSQLGAWASEQSQPLASRAMLDERVANVAREFEGREVPCPPHWGGLRLEPSRIEFWQAEVHRLHTREVYARGTSGWQAGLLFP
jgi:pyridoxamine 5'-phosphate oxidase